jgi:hypothetical protein
MLTDGAVVVGWVLRGTHIALLGQGMALVIKNGALVPVVAFPVGSKTITTYWPVPKEPPGYTLEPTVQE